MDEIELNDLDNHHEREEENEEEETDFEGSNDEDDLLDNLDWLWSKGKPATSIEKLFGNRDKCSSL